MFPYAMAATDSLLWKCFRWLRLFVHYVTVVLVVAVSWNLIVMCESYAAGFSEVDRK